MVLLFISKGYLELGQHDQQGKGHKSLQFKEDGPGSLHYRLM